MIIINVLLNYKLQEFLDLIIKAFYSKNKVNRNRKL